MNFEEMRKMWDHKHQANLFVVDERIIYEEVIKKAYRIDKSINIFELAMLAIFLVMALVMIVEGVADQEYYQLPQGIIFLTMAGYSLWDRRQRLSLENQPGESVLERINKSITQLDYHLKRQRGFIWWFVLPIVATVIIQFIYTYDGKPIWVWPMVALSLVLSNWLVRKESKYKWLPQKRELESLKKLILE